MRIMMTTIPTDGRINLDTLAEGLRREAQAFDDDLGSDPEADAGTARLLREAARAIDLVRRAADTPGDYYAAWSPSGMHIGLWESRVAAEEAIADMPGSLIVPLRRAAIPSEQGGAVATGEDWRTWCEEWHAAVESAALMLGLRVGLGASEFVEAVRSYAHPAPAAGVKVKALEWEDPSPKNNNVWVARTVLGTYCVGCEGGWWYAVLDEGFRHWEWEPENDARSYSGPFAAQAAAQQDYEARILSALDQGEPK
jgi:hypothetical protein